MEFVSKNSFNRTERKKRSRSEFVTQKDLRITAKDPASIVRRVENRPESWKERWHPTTENYIKDDLIERHGSKANEHEHFVSLKSQSFDSQDLIQMFQAFRRIYKPASDEKYFQLYKSLVKKSEYMLNLKLGWDEDEAEAIEPELFRTSTTCVLEYVKAIYQNRHVLLENPKILPVPNGSIDFEWNTENARLLINFRRVGDQIVGFFYGDLYDNKLAIKGNVPTDRVYNHLMEWMQNL